MSLKTQGPSHAWDTNHHLNICHYKNGQKKQKITISLWQVIESKSHSLRILTMVWKTLYLSQEHLLSLLHRIYASLTESDVSWNPMVYVVTLCRQLSEAHSESTQCCPTEDFWFIMPPTLKKVRRHIGFGSSVGACICVSICDTFWCMPYHMNHAC